MNHRNVARLCSIGGLVALTSAIGVAAADHDHQPTPEQIQFAKDTSDLMTNTVVAALVQEIGETTPQNAANGMQSISLVFNDHNHDMRLVGTLQPVRRNDYPEDRFERDALAAAMNGTASTSVERVDGKWMYRRTIPLSNFAPQCAMCHSNFASLPSTAWVGMLALRVPIERDHDDD